MALQAPARQRWMRKIQAPEHEAGTSEHGGVSIKPAWSQCERGRGSSSARGTTMSMTAGQDLERCGACGQEGVVKGHGKFCSCCGAAVRPAGMRLPRAPRFGWMPLLALAVVIMGLSSGPMPFLR